MKKLGIIFAMEEELSELKKFINITKCNRIYDLVFYEGKINNNFCILVKSGVGKVNSARCTQILIDNYKIDYVFNIGVAGGIDNKLKVGDIIIGNKLVQHDFDITAFNHKKGYIPNTGVYINSDEYLLKLSKSISNNKGIHIGVIASGDIFCTDYSMSKKINNKFNALCVEMEGAAVAQVCYLCDVPFLIIRSISDVPNNENVVTYEEFLVSSSKKVANFMKNIIDII